MLKRSSSAPPAAAPPSMATKLSPAAAAGSAGAAARALPARAYDDSSASAPNPSSPRSLRAAPRNSLSPHTSPPPLPRPRAQIALPDPSGPRAHGDAPRPGGGGVLLLRRVSLDPPPTHTHTQATRSHPRPSRPRPPAQHLRGRCSRAAPPASRRFQRREHRPCGTRWPTHSQEAGARAPDCPSRTQLTPSQRVVPLSPPLHPRAAVEYGTRAATERHPRTVLRSRLRGRDTGGRDTRMPRRGERTPPTSRRAGIRRGPKDTCKYVLVCARSSHWGHWGLRSAQRRTGCRFNGRAARRRSRRTAACCSTTHVRTQYTAAPADPAPQPKSHQIKSNVPTHLLRLRLRLRLRQQAVPPSSVPSSASRATAASTPLHHVRARAAAVPHRPRAPTARRAELVVVGKEAAGVPSGRRRGRRRWRAHPHRAKDPRIHRVRLRGAPRRHACACVRACVRACVHARTQSDDAQNGCQNHHPRTASNRPRAIFVNRTETGAGGPRRGRGYTTTQRAWVR